MNVWVKSLVGYLLIVSVVTKMLPGSKYEQYVRLFTGFLLILLVLQPLLKIGAADGFLEERIRHFVQEQEMLEEKISMQGEAFRKEQEALRQEETSVEIEEIEQIRVEVILDD